MTYAHIKRQECVYPLCIAHRTIVVKLKKHKMFIHNFQKQTKNTKMTKRSIFVTFVMNVII